MNNQPKGRRIEIAKRRADVERYWLAGATVAQTAKELGYSEGTIDKDRKALVTAYNDRTPGRAIWVERGEKEWRALCQREVSVANDANRAWEWYRIKELKLRLMERMCRLVGADATLTVDCVGGPVLIGTINIRVAQPPALPDAKRIESTVVEPPADGSGLELTAEAV